MKHEKILKREDGSKVKIIVDCYVGSFDNRVSYSVSVWHAAVNKRKYTHDVGSTLATQEEILAVKMELWQKLKPVL